MTVVNEAGGPLASDPTDVGRGIAVRRVLFDAPWDWLAAGWRDMWAVPGVSIVYGAIFALVAALLAVGATQVGMQSVILALAGGFMLVGPFVAVGLYEASRRLAAGEPVTLGVVLSRSLRPRGQLAFMGLVLMLIFMVWIQLAFLLFMMFSGPGAIPPPSEFVPMLLFTPNGLGLLVVGSIVGAVLALIVFTISAVGLPLLMERDVDIVTAMAASVKTVQLNPQAMLLWAALIAGFTALGLATLFVGLVFAFPLVGHATWHGYKDLIALTGEGE